MAQCPKCFEEIADGAVVCIHCKAILGVPRRPVGFTILSIWLFYSAFSGLMCLFTIKEYNSYFLFFNVPLFIKTILVIIGIALSVYCGYGILKQREKARKVCIYWMYYGILNQICGLFYMNKIMTTALPPGSSMIASIATAISYIAIILGIGISIYIIYYLEKKQDYFIN